MLTQACVMLTQPRVMLMQSCAMFTRPEESFERSADGGGRLNHETPIEHRRFSWVEALQSLPGQQIENVFLAAEAARRRPRKEEDAGHSCLQACRAAAVLTRSSK